MMASEIWIINTDKMNREHLTAIGASPEVSKEMVGRSWHALSRWIKLKLKARFVKKNSDAN